jgi:UPF0716 protein FxsA
MAWLFPVLLLAWPAIEIAAFVEVARWIGVFPAIVGIAAGSLVGLALLRVQGIATLRRAQAQLAAGRPPVGELFDGACLAFAGLLFLLPGYVSDAIGAALLLPPVRFVLKSGALARLVVVGRRSPPPGGPPTIDGEWEVVDDGRPPPRLPPQP